MGHGPGLNLSRKNCKQLKEQAGEGKGKKKKKEESGGKKPQTNLLLQKAPTCVRTYGIFCLNMYFEAPHKRMVIKQCENSITRALEEPLSAQHMDLCWERRPCALRGHTRPGDTAGSALGLC